MDKRTFVQVVAVLTGFLVIAGTASAYYYAKYTQQVALNGNYVSEISGLLAKYHQTLTSNILIDFENGTSHWYNGTTIQPGWNFYTGTLVVTNGDVNSTCCAFGSHFVSGIEGVQNAPSQDRAWLVWTYNGTSWQPAEVGVDQLTMVNGSVFAWTFCKYDPNTGAPLCPKP